ncbi:3'-5' exonuclease [Cohaesibacter gelatinilyticus]|uniref:DNA 3'-5' helicase n=1 Tax=Cohaesibacter gelatinilyticus TaxID=372072 RepID=A0A285PJN7_9HYPH|nr:3'-5' exonuclease [Cohaesibacter gelatinilyticus]SNZ20091.1 Part of AAA domain-containing protein [Cohaesibacter gelatinilyticus]
MNFLISDTFQAALAKLANDEQKAVKLTVFDLQQDPSNPGFKFHRIDKSKDPNFWSVRVNRDIRLIIHKTQSSFLIAYVDHHDDAYKWAERRRIDTHPRTGAAQIVEVRERIEEIETPQQHYLPDIEPEDDIVYEESPASPFFELDEEALLDIGVPQDWLGDVRQANEDQFLELADHIPAEAAEALLEFAVTGKLIVPSRQVPDDPFAHPDAQRRFRIMENAEELERALNYPWDKWAIYLHPDQRQLVTRNYAGPTRISGSAGTGKTVVALHRAAHILRQKADAKLLLTTFSSPLSNALEHKLKLLMDNDKYLDHRVSVRPFDGVAKELFTLINGHDPKLASLEHVSEAIMKASNELGLSGFTDRFLMSEWRYVIDAWQIDSLEAYANVPRLGRKNRLGSKQRERLWPVFGRAREILRSQLRYTPATVFGEVAAYYKNRDAKPFSHIIVDEAQDLGVPELKMISAIAPDDPEALFFAGDLGQRIFQEPFSWLGLGIDIRGRSHTLKVNYRTSHQIRQAADKLLPQIVRDVDGIEEDRRGTVSVFNGPKPDILIHASEEDEVKAIGATILQAIDEGILPEDIGVFVRSDNELVRARMAVREASQTQLELSNRVENRTGRIAIGSMHLAKGLEFRRVIVMACDDEVLPDQDRIDMVADEVELDEVYDTERHLFYVACTRAREKLIVSGIKPASEFFADLKEP